jgi:hypothetical protein
MKAGTLIGLLIAAALVLWAWPRLFVATTKFTSRLGANTPNAELGGATLANYEPDFNTDVPFSQLEVTE